MTLAHIDDSRREYAEWLLGKLSAPDRVIARAWAEGDDNFVQLSAELDVPVEDLAARWNLRILPALREAAGVAA